MSATVECQICHKQYKEVYSSHLRKHKITLEEYVKKYPDAPTLSGATRKKHIERIFSDEHRKKLSEPRKGKTFEEIFGKTKAKEIGRKISNAQIGDKNQFYGKHHTEETRKKISKANTGKKSSIAGKTFEDFYGEERARKIKNKQSKAKEGYIPSLETMFKKGHKTWNKGIPRRPETLEKIKKTRRINNKPSAFKGKTHTDEAKEKMRRVKLGKKHTEETKKKMSAIHIGKTKSKASREKLSKTHKEKWKNPEFRDRRIHEIFEAFRIAPNKTEHKLDNIIQNTIPNEYKFCGGGDVVLGGKVPDWINCNGKKRLIELFGTYWHGKKRTGKTRKEAEDERKTYFKKYGFNTLIIWENQVPNTELIRNTIIEFTNG